MSQVQGQGHKMINVDVIGKCLTQGIGKLNMNSVSLVHIKRF